MGLLALLLAAHAALAPVLIAARRPAGASNNLVRSVAFHNQCVFAELVVSAVCDSICWLCHKVGLLYLTMCRSGQAQSIQLSMVGAITLE